MKHERIWLKKERLSCASYTVGDFASPEFVISDSMHTIVLDKEAARALGLFIVRMLREASDANL